MTCTLKRAVYILATFLVLGEAWAYPANIGFKGGTAQAPENTLATFDNTLDNGGDWIEVDIWVSADGVPVCHADETVDRTTDGTGIIWQKTLAELKTLDAGSWFNPAFAGEQIPTLEEALTLAMGRGKVLLDIRKTGYIDEIAQAIANVGFPPDEVFGYVRLGTAMMTSFKNLLPLSGAFFSTAGPLYFQEQAIWQRTQADDRSDLGIGAASSSVLGHPDWVDLIHSYGMLHITEGVLSPNYQATLALGVDELVVAHPTLLAQSLPLADPECSDGLDNDGDGDFDYPDDAGCFAAEDEAEAAECSDGVDNDGDGHTDYPDDAGCFAVFYDFEAPACSDGVDNNGDGLIDFPADTGCFAVFDQREGLACGDGLDNDNDGLTDFPNDPGCASLLDGDECAPSDCGGFCGGCAPGESCESGTCFDPSPGFSYPTNVGFRGGTVEAPEHTLATYDNTLDKGGEWLELDVWNSSDGVPVCHHDETVDRSTDGTGIIWQKTLAEIKTLDAGSWFDPAFTGEQVPTLEEALTLIQGRGKVLLDIKSNQYIDEIAQAVTNVGFPPEDAFGWIRFGTGMMANFKTLMPASEGFLSTFGPLEFDEEMIWERTQADSRPDLGLIAEFSRLEGYPEWVDLIHSYGLLCFTNGVLSPDFQSAFDHGVDGLVVAHPTLLATLLPQPDPECYDGIDNDGDGDVDYPDDAGCFAREDAAEAAVCSDGIDNDGDGDTDYPDDDGCFAAFYDFEAPQCGDGLDNNGDGDVDYPDDLGCFARFDQREGLACNDAQDNDGDGLTDFPQDPGCDSLVDDDECGPTDCGGPCGVCSAGAVCDPTGTCCTPDCVGKECGDDGCGSSCGTCPSGEVCGTGSICVCSPDCSGRVCGDDGCGGSCGSCVPNDVCDASGSCVCIPDCAGKECGADGCGGSCGVCEPREICHAVGICDCVPDCVGKDCGPDGCGGSCGLCDSGDTCDLLARLCCAPDSDGDGVCDTNDCAPGDDSVFGAPAEIQHLLLVNPTLIAWDSLAAQSGTGVSYQLLSGVLANLPVGGASEICIDGFATSEFAFDTALPPTDSAFYYLVRGSTSCGDGTYGYDSSLTERISAICP